jgi:hypothetical protein
MIKRFVVLAFLAFAPAMAFAETPGRFSFREIDGGVMRLDTQSGQVSHCLREQGQMVCRSVADDRQPLDEEITRLRRENADLKAQIAGRGSAPKVTLPTEEDMDKALGMAERFFRRMMQFFKTEQESGRI